MYQKKNFSEDRLLQFAEEKSTDNNVQTNGVWKLLIVDDEREVHKITRMVLDDLIFERRKLEFLSAYSAEQAKSILIENSDIALVLLDVVMEQENAGLQLVKYIRNTIKNNFVRVILRTGQPGQAPEKSVILQYDINDYREKTELSSQKLLTSVITSLRSYEAITNYANLSRDLERRVRERTAKLEASNKKLQQLLRQTKEDEVAGRRIQFKLLPDKHKNFAGYEFSRYLLPSSFVSGDFVDYFFIDDDHIGFYMADVSGHGVSSAFVTVFLKSFVNNCLSNYKIKKDLAILNPAGLMSKFNRELLQENLGKHIAIFFGLIIIQENTLVYTNAGQFPFPIICKAGDVSLLDDKAPPVGLFEFAKYQNITLQLPNKVGLMIFSDGILEVLPDQDIVKKQAFLRQQLCDPCFSIDALIANLGVWERKSLPDDIAFLMMRRRIADG